MLPVLLKALAQVVGIISQNLQRQRHVLVLFQNGREDTIQLTTNVNQTGTHQKLMSPLDNIAICLDGLLTTYQMMRKVYQHQELKVIATQARADMLIGITNAQLGGNFQELTRN